MKNFIGRMWAKKWLRRSVYIGVVVILAFFIFGSKKQTTYEHATVVKGPVISQVRVTGQVKPKSYASLRFKTAGTIAKTFVDAGDSVTQGQVLATLDTSILSRKVTEARAEVSVAHVADENGAMDVTDTETKNSQALSLLYADAPATFADILNLSHQAFATFATFFDNTNRLLSSISSPILDSQIVLDTNNGKLRADSAMEKLRQRLQNFGGAASEETIDVTIIATRQPIQDLQIALSTVINAVASIPSGAVAASTLESYKNALSTAQSNITSALSAYTDFYSDISDQKVQNTLSLNAARSKQRTASANLEKAQAALSSATQELADATLRAPFSGTIATKGKQMGESVTSSDQMYYLLGEGGLEVVANVAEVEIARLTTSNTVEIRLDAYPGDTFFTGTISDIDPAETIVDGVATYRTTIRFDAPPKNIRSGMTADIRVLTAKRDDVLRVPVRAVAMSKEGLTTVTLFKGEGIEPVETQVTVGLRGSDSMVEILSGISEGDQLVVGTQ